MKDLCPILTYISANVDEVFIDLCRQMLRRDDENAVAEEQDDYKYDSMQKKRRRKRLRDSPRCVVL